MTWCNFTIQQNIDDILFRQDQDNEYGDMQFAMLS